MKPQRWVKRHIAWILAVKIGLITLLFFLFFSPSSRPDLDPDSIGRRLNTPSR